MDEQCQLYWDLIVAIENSEHGYEQRYQTASQEYTALPSTPAQFTSPASLGSTNGTMPLTATKGGQTDHIRNITMAEIIQAGKCFSCGLVFRTSNPKHIKVHARRCIHKRGMYRLENSQICDCGLAVADNARSLNTHKRNCDQAPWDWQVYISKSARQVISKKGLSN